MNAEIEFVPGGETITEPPLRPRRPRWWIALVAIGLAVAAIVVVATNGGGRARSHPNASNSTFAPGPRIGPLPHRPAHFVRPATTVFGPSSVDVVAAGNRSYALSTTQIGTASRSGADPVVRAAPFRAAPAPMLEVDPAFDLVWAVAVGGTTVRGYDGRTLDLLVTTDVGHRISAAVAMDGMLWLATDGGLFVDQAGPDALRRVAGSPHPLSSVIANPLMHTVVVTDERAPVRAYAFSQQSRYGMRRLPLQSVVSTAQTTSGLWFSGIGADGPRVVELDPETLRVLHDDPVPRRLNQTASIVGSYRDRLLIRGAPNTGVYCVDASSGALRQMWRLPLGAVSLDGHGLLVVSAEGVVQRDAHACLSG